MGVSGKIILIYYVLFILAIVRVWCLIVVIVGDNGSFKTRVAADRYFPVCPHHPMNQVTRISVYFQITARYKQQLLDCIG